MYSGKFIVCLVNISQGGGSPDGTVVPYLWRGEGENLLLQRRPIL